MSDETRRQAARLDESIRLGKRIGARGGAPLGTTSDEEMERETSAPTRVAYRVFKRLLEAHDLRYALYSLLRLTDYRFISLFRLEGGTIRSLAHVDRQDLSAVETDAAPESASYCCYVRTEDGPFAVVDSLVDPRVAGHPKQPDLRAYCGIPITSDDGRLMGTLCHYDPVPRDPAQLNRELLALVVGEIVRLKLLE